MNSLAIRLSGLLATTKRLDCPESLFLREKGSHLVPFNPGACFHRSIKYQNQYYSVQAKMRFLAVICASILTSKDLIVVCTPRLYSTFTC